MKKLLQKSSKWFVLLLLYHLPNLESEAKPISFLFLNSELHLNFVDKPVSGKVVSTTGEALQGVTVLLKGTTTGTTTNSEGGFELTVPDNGGTLVVSFIG